MPTLCFSIPAPSVKMLREKVLNRLVHLHHRKRVQSDLVLGVCGCMAQHMKTKLIDAAPYVDFVLGPDAYRNLPMAINSVTTGDPFLGLKPRQGRGLCGHRSHS